MTAVTLVASRRATSHRVTQHTHTNTHLSFSTHHARRKARGKKRERATYARTLGRKIKHFPSPLLGPTVSHHPLVREERRKWEWERGEKERRREKESERERACEWVGERERKRERERVVTNSFFRRSAAAAVLAVSRSLPRVACAAFHRHVPFRASAFIFIFIFLVRATPLLLSSCPHNSVWFSVFRRYRPLHPSFLFYLFFHSSDQFLSLYEPLPLPLPASLFCASLSQPLSPPCIFVPLFSICSVRFGSRSPSLF